MSKKMLKNKDSSLSPGMWMTTLRSQSGSFPGRARVDKPKAQGVMLRQLLISTMFDGFQQSTKISFKSDVVVMFAVEDLSENSFKSDETPPA